VARQPLAAKRKQSVERIRGIRPIVARLVADLKLQGYTAAFTLWSKIFLLEDCPVWLVDVKVGLSYSGPNVFTQPANLPLQPVRSSAQVVERPAVLVARNGPLPYPGLTIYPNEPRDRTH
jgi:hypothetical protein